MAFASKTVMVIPKATLIEALQRYFDDVMFRDGQSPVIADIAQSTRCYDVTEGYEVKVEPRQQAVKAISTDEHGFPLLEDGPIS